jgi:hypothetical protein
MACTERPKALPSLGSAGRYLEVIRASSTRIHRLPLCRTFFLKLPIISNFLLCAKTPPCLGVLLPPAELAFPNYLGTLSSDHIISLPSRTVQTVSFEVSPARDE